MEDQNPGGKGHGHPSLQDTNPPERDIMGCGEHEGQVPPQDASLSLDELFYVYAQIKNLQQEDNKLMLAYEILCLSANHCMDQQNRVKKTGIPDALALLNVADIRYLECLMWVLYDGVLLVGPPPKLLGDWPWCVVLAGLQQHIYKGHEDTTLCPPQMLSSWDHEEWVEALHHVGSLSSVQSG